MDTADVWAEARSHVKPGDLLVRVLCTMRNWQGFAVLPVSAEADLYAGGTIFDRDDYTVDQRAEIINDANAQWALDHASAPA